MTCFRSEGATPGRPAAINICNSRTAVSSRSTGRKGDGSPPDGRVELNLAEAAPLLGITPGTLRRQIKSGQRPGRQGENGYWLAQLEVSALRDRDDALTPRGAAELLGLKPATVKRRCQAGKYSGARRGPEGWRIPLGDLL